jgi:hypothetical protein
MGNYQMLIQSATSLLFDELELLDPVQKAFLFS